ncbi:MAG TPA: hypothetical protein ENN87_16845, partial [Phycisphaerales bacterium]|nr:hypothetical protein [Phycisphaerales bacterium]
MVVHDLEKILLEELHYAESPGFLREERIRWPSRRSIPDVDAALFVGKNPLAYFSRLSELDPEKIRQLHKNVWSQSKVPLLFVTLPHEIRVYNAYESPIASRDEDFDTPSRLLQSLAGLNDSLTAQRRIREKLVANHYERIYLETGAFWDTVEGQKVDHQTRADHRLVKDMGTMRERLVGRGLSNAVTYTLLGRSIFVRYLEDRGVLTPKWIEQMTNGRATSYRRLFAHTLSDRGFVYQSNPIKGNKPVTLGHQYESLVVLLERATPNSPRWVSPLMIRRITTNETENQVGAEMLKAVLSDEQLPFHNDLV